MKHDHARFQEWSSHERQSVHLILRQWEVHSYLGVVLCTLYELCIVNKLAWAQALKWKPFSQKKATREPHYGSLRWVLNVVFHCSHQAECWLWSTLHCTWMAILQVFFRLGTFKWLLSLKWKLLGSPCFSFRATSRTWQWPLGSWISLVPKT